MMNLLLLFGNAVCTFLIINIGLVDPHIDNPNYWIGVGLSFTAGFGLRIVGDVRKGNFTIKNSFIQFFTSVFLCYLAYRVREDFTPGIRIEYYIFCCAFSSVFIIDTFEKKLHITILEGIKMFFRKLATPVSETEIKTPEPPEKGGLQP